MILTDVFIQTICVCVGALLLVKSQMSVGRDPRCGHCGYQLSGLTSNRCPECGRLFIEAGISLGKRSLSRTAFWLGRFLILASFTYYAAHELMTYYFQRNQPLFSSDFPPMHGTPVAPNPLIVL